MSRPRVAPAARAESVGEEAAGYRAVPNSSAEDHLSYPVNRGGGASLGTDYNGWQQGKEYQANYYAADGTTLLRSEATTWEQRNCTADSSQCWFLKDGTHGGDPNHAPATSVNDPNAPPHDARAAQKSETVAGAGGSQSVTSLEKYFYSDANDTYNNQIEADEYGYPSGATLVRKKLTTYQTSGTYTSGPHLISLPISQTVKDSGNNLLSQTSYAYDETALAAASGISSYDSTFSTTFRGNATTVTQLLNGTSNGANGTIVTKYAYECAGRPAWNRG